MGENLKTNITCIDGGKLSVSFSGGNIKNHIQYFFISIIFDLGIIHILYCVGSHVGVIMFFLVGRTYGARTALGALGSCHAFAALEAHGARAAIL